MAHKYHYRRAGQQSGPVSTEELRGLAASGHLRPEDYVWREGLPQWVPAGKVKGLFPTVPPPFPVAVPVPPEGPEGENPLTTIRPGAQTRARARLERFGADLGLGWKPLLAALLGGVFLLLLILTTPFAWYTVWLGKGEFKVSDLFSYTETGLETSAGKVIGLTAVLAAGALGLSLFLVRRLLPAGLLAAGAAGTFAIIMLVSYWGAASSSLGDWKEGAHILKDTVQGGVQFPFYVAGLAAVGTVAAFIFASLHKPLELVFLRNLGAGPWVEKHGGLIGAQSLAVFFGLVVYVAFLLT